MGTASMVQPPQVFFSPLEIGAGGGYGLGDRGGRDDFCPALAFGCDQGRIHVVAMDVREQNQIGLRQAREDGGFGWVHHYDFATPLR